jgi:hypothetical protein
VSTAPRVPQFCAWCGSPIPYEEHRHEPRYQMLAERARAEGSEPPRLPDRVEETLAGEAFLGACPGCKMVSHVVGHRPGEHR